VRDLPVSSSLLVLLSSRHFMVTAIFTDYSISQTGLPGYKKARLYETRWVEEEQSMQEGEKDRSALQIQQRHGRVRQAAVPGGERNSSEGVRAAGQGREAVRSKSASAVFFMLVNSCLIHVRNCLARLSPAVVAKAIVR
jgi:hypothetical protein